MRPGPTRGKFGQYAVAEPFHADVTHIHKGQALRERSWDIPIPVLDQEDLVTQGIDTSKLIPGAQKVDELGSCTANASMASLAQVLVAAGRPLSAAGLSGNEVADEERAIVFYHQATDQTGDPSQEWPPTDCGSTGLYCCHELIRQNLITTYKTASGAVNLLSLLQSGSVIMGGPWFNSWMNPDSDGFVDGDGSMDALQAAIDSGVAGGHETCARAIVQLAATSSGTMELENTVVQVRNSWSADWALSGDHRLHASTLNWLASYYDFKQFVV